jgi:hypothetical protein
VSQSFGGADSNGLNLLFLFYRGIAVIVEALLRRMPDSVHTCQPH